MNTRAKLAWVTLTVLALGAEGTAAAESTPGRANSANDPGLALMQQSGAAMGPELAAALASLGGTTSGTTKKSDKGASVDWNRLGNRQAAAGDTVVSGLGLPSAAASTIQSKSGGADSLQVLHGAATGATSTVAGPAIRVVPVGDIQQVAAPTSAPPLRPEAVIRGQINPAAKSCYANDPDSKSRRPGRLVILIKLTPAGEIDSVSVPINTGVSPSVASCITTAARAASFAAPGASGATIPAAFTFPGPAEQAPSADPPAKDEPATNASEPAAHDTLAADAQSTNQPTKP
jgi:hypothetical protein